MLIKSELESSETTLANDHTIDGCLSSVSSSSRPASRSPSIIRNSLNEDRETSDSDLSEDCSAHQLFKSVSNRFCKTVERDQIKCQSDENYEQSSETNRNILLTASSVVGNDCSYSTNGSASTSSSSSPEPRSLLRAANYSTDCLTKPEENGHTETQPNDFITIIHFNDCYNIEPGPKSSGAAGFLTAINQYRHLNPMILFSGDILSPSFMSTFTKGEQMIPVLNDIGVHCAVFGNHEFDYGVDNLIDFTKRTTFPWLLSNVIDKETSNQLGDGLEFHIIERSGVKFGLIGLIEEEWLSTLSTLDSSDVIYTDYVIKGRELACWLKGPAHNVDYVIALTHFRTPNDIRLADSVPEIDLILGGHDHDYEVIQRPNCYIIKSGTDFREFSLISLRINADQVRKTSQTIADKSTNSDIKLSNQMDIERIDCSSYTPEPNLKSKLDKFVTTIDEKMGKVLGQFNCELDGRFSSIRNYETNLGNFVTDIMLASTHADLAILNSGTLRSDRIHPKGDFTMRDLFNILGYIDPIAVLQASGYHIWKALENGVSQWPKLEGRFPQISGCSFVFDPSKPALHRIDPETIMIGEEPLVLDKFYKLTTKAYLASGKDGYDVLKECETLVPGDESPDLTTSILNHFEAISIIKSNRRTHHRQSIICLSRSSLKKILDQTTSSSDNHDQLQSMHSYDNNNNTDNHDNTTDCTIDETPEEQELHKEDETGAGNQPEVCTNTDCHSNGHIEGPATSSPLIGSNAPTPTLKNLQATDTLARRSSCLSPLSTIQKQTRQARTKRVMSLYEMEHEQCKLEPKTEGRIKILGVNYCI